MPNYISESDFEASKQELLNFAQLLSNKVLAFSKASRQQQYDTRTALGYNGQATAVGARLNTSRTADALLEQGLGNRIDSALKQNRDLAKQHRSGQQNPGAPSKEQGKGPKGP